MNVRVVAFCSPGLRVERQAVSDGRIAWNEKTALAAQEPRARLPARAVRAAGYRQHVADDPIQSLLEYSCQTLAFHRIFQPRIERIDIHRQAALAPQIVECVFVSRKYQFWI